MPSAAASSSSGVHADDYSVPILTFEQLSSHDNPDEGDPNAILNPTDDSNGDTPDTIDEPIEEDTPRAVSKQRLYLMVFADFGLSFTWLCKFAVATPYFQHSLKAGAFLSHLVWIMGPLSGLIVAPVIGVLSDRCTWQLGRRRPFIIVGCIFSIIGMLIFANVIAITKGQLFLARLLAVFSFGLLDFSTNVIMFPSRALLGDLLPTYQQHDAQSAAAVIASIGEICAGAYIYSLKDAVTHISRIFSIASILLTVSSSISIYVCHETPLSSSSNISLEPIPQHQRKNNNILNLTNAHNNQLKEQNNTHTHQYRSFVSHGTREQHIDDDEDIKMLTLNDEDPVPLSPVSNTANTSNINDPETSAPSPSSPRLENKDSFSVASDHTTIPMSSLDEKLNTQTLPPIAPLTSSSSTQPIVPSQSNTVQAQGLKSELMDTIGTALKNFPRALIPIGMVYGLAWFLWFASLPFYSQWIGVDVLGGDAHASVGSTEASLYQQGVQVFSIANMVKAVTALIFAAFYPTIITCIGNIGERMVFSISFFVFSFILFFCADTKDVYVAAFVIALGAIPFIVTQTIPIAIVVQRYPHNLASNLGVMNLFCVIPQLVDTLYTGKVAEVAGESVVLKVAAGWGFATAMAAIIFL